MLLKALMCLVFEELLYIHIHPLICKRFKQINKFMRGAHVPFTY